MFSLELESRKYPSLPRNNLNTNFNLFPQAGDTGKETSSQQASASLSSLSLFAFSTIFSVVVVACGKFKATFFPVSIIFSVVVVACGKFKATFFPISIIFSSHKQNLITIVQQRCKKIKKLNTIVQHRFKKSRNPCNIVQHLFTKNSKALQKNYKAEHICPTALQKN